MSNVIDTENYKFDFGQYYGYTYKEILKIDPAYIKWCYLSLGQFELSTPDTEELVKAVHDQSPDLGGK